jgi:DNA polymerase-3 subunit gamma/tau
MSYQVLARKWRPKRFAELVGQEHVVRALTHALVSGRIHHAFLFTGTRGVGKTTIARIFAKSLNCETGVSAEPCGVCTICRDIDAGRFLDLLEIDAASNTGVDDVREVIENAQYRPVRGGYKVYLIDEVHMLSKNAFNALLKTLEEPPEHAKFLLATTDPQKLPVTVLSRCLQFNLKRLSEEQIGGQVERILQAEDIAHDADAVAEIARGGNGSMRDALSLLDQAIAFGGGKLAGDEVRTMLGTIDRTRVGGLLEAIAADDPGALYARIAELAEFVPDFATVLDEVAALLHRIQLRQFLGESALAPEPAVAALAQALGADEVQLLYQLAITGRRDLGMAPNPRAGFEMTLLRMLAFRPARDGGGATLQSPPPAAPARTLVAAEHAIAGAPASAPTPRAAVPAASATARSDATAPARSSLEPAVRTAAPAAPPPQPVTPTWSGPVDAERWPELLAGIKLSGPVREFANNVVPIAFSDARLRLGIAPNFEHLRSDGILASLAAALAPALGRELKIQVESVATAVDTVAHRSRRESSQRQQHAEAAIAADPAVQSIVSLFDARIVPQSTRPSQPE